MIKTLQKRFIFTAMIAISVLILLLLGAINIANVIMGQNGIENRIRIISEAGGDPGRLPKPDTPGDFGMKPKDDHDIVLSSTYFVVRYDRSGYMVYLDAEHIASLTEEEMIEMSQAALPDGGSGREGRFYYTVTDDQNGGKTLIFLDTTDEFYACIRVLILSAGTGLLCWTLMLLFVILLSERAIHPIAENIEKQKQFVTNAGHEIKTPLAIIQSNADALELYGGKNKWTDNIRQQTVRLNGLMKNLLLLAKMDESNIALNITRVSLSETVREMTDSFAEPMQRKGIAMDAVIEPQLFIDADREQMTQLFSILFDNARKYAKENSTVVVSLKKEEKHITFKIKNFCDTLPAVPPEQLFERFYRADEARTQKSGGYGIGLSVARGIVKAAGGKIKAAYETDDVISFTVLF